MPDQSVRPHPPGRPVIATPDQRLRVFISSTLDELAPERTAAREAVEKLRLTPVLFELGARPHPPRDLYRSYLDQSHVFVGIYGRRYGWIAPGESISGLEDEYRLSGYRPKLIYIQQALGRGSRGSRSCSTGSGPRAHAAGMRVIAIPNCRYPPPGDVLALADVAIETLAEVTVTDVSPRES